MKAFKQKYTLVERQKKSQKQIQQNPGKLPVIAEPHPFSKLPQLPNTKFLCDSHYNINSICNILVKKIQKQSGDKNSKAALFVYVNKKLIRGDETVENIYKKQKDQDGFLYLTYGQMETFG